jgi:hypothetical protein
LESLRISEAACAGSNSVLTSYPPSENLRKLRELSN